MIKVIENFFTTEERNILPSILKREGHWWFGGSSNVDSSRIFWKKNLYNTELLSLFTNKIQRCTGHKIFIEDLYVNGQAHGQCGEWHTDDPPPAKNCFTIVYFWQDWQPEFGGHLLIKTDIITSILPEFNKAVLFDSTLEHVGLEPTIHCKTQRESIACKFKLID